MKKRDLINQLHGQTKISKEQINMLLSALPDVIIDAIEKNEKVQIMGLGTFHPTKRAAREGKHPKTGKPMHISASLSIGFKAAETAKKRLNAR